MIRSSGRKQTAPLTDAQLAVEISRNHSEFLTIINTSGYSEKQRDLCQTKWLYLDTLRTVRASTLVAA